MLPTLTTLFGIPIRSYGFFVLVGFLLGLWYVSSVARRRMAGKSADTPGLITPDRVFDLSIVLLFVCILGARLLFVALDWKDFANRPQDILKIWSGGLSIHGSIISGILYLAWYCRRHKINFLEFGDLMAQGFAIGYAFGRIGCLLNGCCYGHECSLPWAVNFKWEDGLMHPSHPIQIYAFLMNLAAFCVMHLYSRKPRRNGELFYGYLIFYAISRYIDEVFRSGATADTLAFGQTHAQMLSIVVLPILVALLIRVRRIPFPLAS